MSSLTDNERLNLDKMIKASGVENNTDKIRELKHSSKIKEDVQKILNLKGKYSRLEKSNPNEFSRMCESQCIFLFSNYTQLFNKVKKNELDLNLLAHFLVILEKIENGSIDQHEGSVMVGKVLKEMYIDSALREEKNLDKKHKNNSNNKEKVLKPKKISYKEFKKMEEK